MYIFFTDRAVEDLNKLDDVVKRRIGNKLRILQRDPIKNARPINNPKIGSYRFTVGNHRLIFDIDENKVIILRVGDKKSITK